MSNGKKAVCLDFENEMWLFISKELPVEQMDFWKNHLSECDLCMCEMEAEMKIISDLKKETLVDIDDESFKRMINSASRKRKFELKNIFGTGNTSRHSKNIYGKAAFTGALAVIAIIISLITHQPVPVEKIPEKILDWNGAEIATQINQIKNQINILSGDKWDREILFIDKKIQKMEKESDEFSFN
ncbi:MAG: hypothetical protein CVV24_00380 [Ignavibacteriae bacterium HGW-Ignavibacteriae-3]|nr:MAG: hypothetical protein CVV24_00380 [Ignavibacteriae bacterium HGW-Ignavibacteriae-3]